MTTSPKIGVVGFPALYGGAGTELDNQLTLWSEMGYDVHIVPTHEVLDEPLLKIKRDENPGYEDGDIMFAPNNRRIKDVHAQHICHRDNFGFNSDGLRPTDCLTEVYLLKTSEYKFVRVNQNEVKRISLATMDEEVIGAVPNAKGEHIDVPRFLANAVKNPRHLIFGNAGREYWFGGRRYSSPSNLVEIWGEIESRTPLRSANFNRWPFSDHELKTWL